MYPGWPKTKFLNLKASFNSARLIGRAKKRGIFIQVAVIWICDPVCVVLKVVCVNSYYIFKLIIVHTCSYLTLRIPFFKMATSYTVFRLRVRCTCGSIEKGAVSFCFFAWLFCPKKLSFFLSSTKAVIGMLCKEVSMCKRVEITKNSFTGSFPFAPPPPQQGHWDH